MPDQDNAAPTPDAFQDAARRSQEAGIADESAAYDNAIEGGAPPSIDEGDPKTKDDGSGTSETD